MQNFTGTGFSNEEIKKEDIVKQVKSKREAIMSLFDMDRLFNKLSIRRLEQGAYLHYNENRSKKAEQEADRLEDEFKQRKTQMIEYLKAMPHD